MRLRRSRARLVVDWHELWAAGYWRSYLGPVGGRIGMAVQLLCLRLSDHNFTFSRLVEGRLHAQRPGATTTRLTGEYAGVELGDVPAPQGAGASVVFAGRHIREKRVTEIPAVVAVARRQVAEADCTILGDGPETEAVRERVRALGLEDAVEVRGRVDSSEVAATIAAAGCLLHPSEREGYGQVVVEAFALGTPAIVVAGPENAAVELVEPGVNGFVADSHDPEELGALVVRVLEAGEELRRSTRDWYAAHREELSLGHSLEIVVATYASLSADAT